MSVDLMDKVPLMGVEFILWIQHYFKGQAETMLFLSHIGDPKNAFLVYFPVAYFCHRTTGMKVMWAAVVSEWLNSAFKWMLFGHRPYWWIHTSGVYGENIPYLEQYRLTCETGPGSPSGHAMVTSAVMFVLLRCYLSYTDNKTKRRVTRVVLWTSFVLLMLLISISRCFIATHFPHQVVAGVIAGSVIGEAIFRYNTDDISLRTCVFLSIIILLSGPVFYSLVSLSGHEPMWSVVLCQLWCGKREWIHLDTTLFYATTRDASVLLSTCLGFRKTRAMPQEDRISVRAVLEIVISIAFAISVERLGMHQQEPLVFYITGFAKYVLVFGIMSTSVRPLLEVFWPRSNPAKKTG